MFSYTWNNNCFSVAENSLYDGINKLDVTITNWCLKTETITLTLACSATPPPELAGCETVGKPVSDPSCPAGPTKTYCSNSIPPVCMQLYSEKCSNDVKYYCVKDSVLPAFCMQCKPGSTVDGKPAMSEVQRSSPGQPDVQAKEE